jgi:two-component system LytT family response regulator
MSIQQNGALALRGQRLRPTANKIPVWKENSILLLNANEVLYFTANDGEVDVVTNHGRYCSRNSLQYWEERMKEKRFFRTHKSFLVNLDKVRQAIPFFNYTFLLKLDGIKDEIPVSRNYLREFKQLMF